MKHTEYFFNKILAQVEFDVSKNMSLINTSPTYRRAVQIAAYASLTELEAQEDRLEFVHMPKVFSANEGLEILSATRHSKLQQAEEYLIRQAIAKVRVKIRSLTANLSLRIKPKERAEPATNYFTELQHPGKLVDLYAREALYVGHLAGEDGLYIGEENQLKGPILIKDIADFKIDFACEIRNYPY